jgi:hypothetical protein
MLGPRAARSITRPARRSNSTRTAGLPTPSTIHRDDADAHPEFVASLRRAGAEVLVVDVDPAEFAGVTITEVDDDQDPHGDHEWDRELGGVSDGHTVYSDAATGL